MKRYPNQLRVHNRLYHIQDKLDLLVDFEELETPGQMMLSNTWPTMLNLHKHKNHLLCIRRCDCSNSKFPVFMIGLTSWFNKIPKILGLVAKRKQHWPSLFKKKNVWHLTNDFLLIVQININLWQTVHIVTSTIITGCEKKRNSKLLVLSTF